MDYTKEEAGFVVKIPARNKSAFFPISVPLKSGAIKKLDLLLVNDDKDEEEDDLEKTVLASVIFKPVIRSFISLKISLTDKKILINPTYNLPPLFKE